MQDATRQGNARRQRDRRARLRVGSIVAPVEIDRRRLLEALRAAGLVELEEKPDDRQLAAYAAGVLVDFTVDWIGHHENGDDQ